VRAVRTLRGMSRALPAFAAPAPRRQPTPPPAGGEGRVPGPRDEGEGRVPDTRDEAGLAPTLVRALSRWLDRGGLSLGAALAYYTLFSIAPLLLIVSAIAGLVFGAEAARGEIVGQLQSLMGREGAAAVEAMLASLGDAPAAGAGALFGVVLLLIGATTVFAELQGSLDRLWDAPPPPPGRGPWGLIRTRLLAFGVVLALGFLLVVSLAASALIAALRRVSSPPGHGLALRIEPAALEALNAGAGFVVAAMLFTLVLRWLPSAQVPWRAALIGGGFTASLFTLGRVAIGAYVEVAADVPGIGAAGSLAALLVWVYAAAQVLFIGAALTHECARTPVARAPVRRAPAPSAPPVASTDPSGPSAPNPRVVPAASAWPGPTRPSTFGEPAP
jgi:membrane protein